MCECVSCLCALLKYFKCVNICLFFIKGGDRTSSCMHLLSVKWSVIFFPCFLSFYFLSLTVIMKGTALIISRMKGTRKTCSQTFPWKQKKTQSEISIVIGRSPLLLSGLPYNLQWETFNRLMLNASMAWTTDLSANEVWGSFPTKGGGSSHCLITWAAPLQMTQNRLGSLVNWLAYVFGKWTFPT